MSHEYSQLFVSSAPLSHELQDRQSRQAVVQDENVSRCSWELVVVGRATVRAAKVMKSVIRARSEKGWVDGDVEGRMVAVVEWERGSVWIEGRCQ